MKKAYIIEYYDRDYDDRRGGWHQWDDTVYLNKNTAQKKCNELNTYITERILKANQDSYIKAMQQWHEAKSKWEIKNKENDVLVAAGLREAQFKPFDRAKPIGLPIEEFTSIRFGYRTPDGWHSTEEIDLVTE